ncbi:ParA family protein [uncultured Sphingomonas sp.]|uniref:ParA family protein n=1 Tax=uncultured Sphingomonas sp. TaxID=158754 RepID=UPI00374914BF
MAKRIVVFNHKGGVSKTTSAYNLGWMMAENARVLLVDADPQCNLTGLLLRDDFERYYLDAETHDQNIKDGVAATFTGRPVPIRPVDCFRPGRAPNLHLLAGHANLSEYDAALTFAQTSNNALATLQNLPGAFAELLRLTEERYAIDLTIIDLNPGLSAINQNLFLISDAFLIPTNPDPFSLMALDTLQTILPRWAAWKSSAVPLFADSAYPLPVGSPKFIGTLIQRFNVRNGRAARPYRDNIAEIKEKVSINVVPALQIAGMTLDPAAYAPIADYCLGEIPDFQGLLPKSHDAGVPVFALRDDEIQETGPVLANAIERRDRFAQQFSEICGNLFRMIDYA